MRKLRCGGAGPWCAAVAIGLIGMVLAGCGGGGGGTSTPAASKLAGIFTGNAKQTRAVGDTGIVELDIQTSSSGTLTGTARLTLNNAVYTGPISGTVNGNSANITVAYTTYGSVTYTGSITSPSGGVDFTGTFQHTLSGGRTEGGTVTLAKQVGVQTVTVSGSYSGTYTEFGQSPDPLSVTIQQNGDSLTVNGNSNGTPFTGTGTIIGTNITYGTATADQGTATYSGTVASTVTTGPFNQPVVGVEISGSYNAVASDGSGSTSGIWSITKQ